MNPIIRNFWSIFRRFRLAMTLNVLGMAIAFAAFMVIMMQWHYDVTFDDATPHGDCIFRVESELTGLGSTPVVSRPYAESFIQSSAHIESGCLLYAMDIPLFLTVRDELSGQESYFNELCNPATPSLTRVFDFEMLEGSADALEVENQLLIPESLARKWFGNQSALGKRVETGDLQLFREDKAYIVGGVYRDFPQNSTLQNVVYASAGDFAKNDWGEVSYSFFVRLDDPSVASDLLDNFKVYAQRLDFNLEEYPFFFNYIRPLKDLHWVEGLNFDSVPKASRQTSYLLFTIAWVIIFIAAINFTNFSTALAPIRMRSINTQRVLGSTVGHLRWQLAAEAMLVSFLAFLLSILFLYVAKENGFDEKIAPIDILDSDAHMDLPLSKGYHLKFARTGSHFANYDTLISIVRFKAHYLDIYGGTLKNLSICMGTGVEGKCLIHSTGKVMDHFVSSDKKTTCESMSDAVKAAMEAKPGRWAFINVIDSFEPTDGCERATNLGNIGILASYDPVAVDQAAIDITFGAAPDSQTRATWEEHHSTMLTAVSEANGVGKTHYRLTVIQ